MNSYIRIAATQMFPRDMVCLRNISVDTLDEGDTDDDDDDDDDNTTTTTTNNNNTNNNNNNSLTANGLSPGGSCYNACT